MASSEAPDRQDERVMIVDDHAFVRNAIRSTLAGYPGIHVVGEASNGLEAVMLMEKLDPSIVLMDVNMPRMNGIEATAHIKSDYPHTVIIGLSVNVSPEHHKSMIRAGAVGLIPKEEASDLLFDTIQEAMKSR